MPIDAYALCPGGTGKRIRFCCPDFLRELERIERMIQGDQHVACLQHIERLEQQHPDRACLLAIKAQLFRATGQAKAAVANAAQFLQKHPGNPVALAESALVTAATAGGKAAMPALQQALAASAGDIQPQAYEAIGTVAEAMLAEGEFLSGQALLQLQAAIGRDDPAPMQVLAELYHSAEVPLLLKGDLPLVRPPDDAPWKSRFDEALAPLARGQWQAAADRLAALAEAVPDSPAVLGHLARVRAWLAESSGCAAALKKFAALDVPLEDAVEAVTLALLLAEDPLGDLADVQNASWTVKDVEQAQTALLSDARVSPVSFEPAALADEDNPPPKAIYLLLDRPPAATAENITLDAAAKVLGQAMLYGRQTDRAARLEVHSVVGNELSQVSALLGAVCGDALDGEARLELVARVSASQELLQRKWRLPGGTSSQQVESLTAEHLRRALLEQWPQTTLGVLDGRCAREAAADPACRVTLLAAILLLHTWNELELRRFDLNQLRRQLGLPTLEPIDPQQAAVEKVPLVRLSRVMAERLSDMHLLAVYRRAVAFGATEAARRFAAAIVARPTLAKHEAALAAYRTLARSAERFEEALEHVAQGRQAAEAAGQSSASWDLLELSLRFGQGQPQEASRLINHIYSQHLKEQGVAEALNGLLMEVGVMRPDGTLNVRRRPQEPSAVAQPAEAEPGKLWTPDSQQSGGGGTLWVPE